ncbi:MAG: hypothetical protein ACOYI6_08770 [Christensenellales bacterium]|jgi:hypothetical protein|nr:hypothetical protein [Chloroflexota bacterium]
MTEHEAAKKWGVTANTVRNWCKDGLFETASISQVKKSWQIADGTLKPHRFRGNVHKTFTGRLALILRSLDKTESITPARLNLDRSELKEHFLTLQEAGYVREKHNLTPEEKNTLDLFRCYTLTTEGGNRLKGERVLRRIASDLSPAISALSEGATKAIISKCMSGDNS